MMKINPKTVFTNSSNFHWIGVLFFLIFQINLSAQWVCDCTNRVPITINGNTEVLTDYQVKLTVPSFPDINADFSNILFTTDDETTEIDHWTQTFNATTGIVWVEIPSIPIGGTTIYMYYGNCGSEGDPSQVFDYFNDFDDLTGAMVIGTGTAVSNMIGGESVLQKITNCDPNGVYFDLGFTIDDYTLVTRETRESDDITGCSQNRYGIENSDFDGYGIRRNGESGADFGMERRANGVGGNSLLTGVAPAISQDSFVITELSRCTAMDQNFADVFSNDGTSVVSVSGTIPDNNYSDFDRIAIRGGRNYSIDYMGVAKFSCDPPSASFGTSEVDDPEAICMNITAELDASGSITILDDAVDDGSNDNCDNSLSFSLSLTDFDCTNIGDNTVTLTVTDNQGNTDQCMTTITIEDNIAPVITCPADITIDTDASSCEASSVTLTMATATDNCSVDLISNDAPTVFPIGTTIVTWTATDPSGNSSTCEQAVRVVDNFIPNVMCPPSITVSAGPSCVAIGVDLGAITATDNCDSIVITNDAPDSFPLGITIVEWTVTDTSGNVAVCMQEITVIDSGSPVITCAPTDTLIADVNCEAVTVILEDPAFMDNCSISSVTNDAPAVFPIGTTTVTWTVSDDNSNMATCTQDVVVIDETAPTIVCPSTVTVSTDIGLCTASGVALGMPSFTDNCSGSTVANDAPSIFPLGTTMVTWTVTDASGNMATCIQQVIVEDNTAPQIACPANIFIDADAGECFASSVLLGTPSNSDNCPGQTVSNNAPSTFPVGITMVTWTVTDAAGNSTSCIQEVTIRDSELPSITCPGDVTVSTDFDACIATNFNLGTPLTGDNCGINTVINNAPSTLPLGTTTIEWTVIDDSGNVSTCMQTVTVEDTQAPTFTCPSNVTIECTDSTDPDDTGMATNEMDNCGVNTISFNDVIVEGSCSSEFTIQRTWTITDDAGIMAQCVQNITVEDTTAPTASNPSAISVQCFSDIPAANIAVVTDEADNCDGTPVVAFVSDLSLIHISEPTRPY